MLAGPQKKSSVHLHTGTSARCVTTTHVRVFLRERNQRRTEGHRHLPDFEVPSGTHRKEGLVGEARANPASKGKVARLCAESSTWGSQCAFVTSPFSKAEASLMVLALSLYPSFWPRESKVSRAGRPSHKGECVWCAGGDGPACPCHTILPADGRPLAPREITVTGGRACGPGCCSAGLQ